MNFIPGDILLYTAPALQFSNIIPKLIRLVEGSQVEHVAIYLGYNKGHVILEALSDGVKIKTLSDTEIYTRTIKPANGFVLYGVSRLQNIEVSSKNTVFTISAAKYNQSPYGYLTDINMLLQHGKCILFPKKPWTVWFKSKKGYICSEVAQLTMGDVLELNNIPLPFKKIACLTQPSDYLYEPWQVIINNN